MAFIISKIFNFLVSPVAWIAISAIVSVFLLVKKRKNVRLWIFVTIALFFVFTNPFIINLAFHNWEKPWLKNIHEKHYDYAVVLSGMVSYDKQHDRFNFGQSADRVLKAATLFHSQRIDKILLSGGNASITTKQPPEAVLLKRFLLSLNVPDSCIITENKSRNTHENALYTKNAIESGFSRQAQGLLITSAYHMSRATACFQAQRICITPCPVDFYVPQLKTDIGSLIVPSVEALSKWDILLHEWLGLLYYKTRGFI